jgi:hypothetical protein
MQANMTNLPLTNMARNYKHKDNQHKDEDVLG